MEFVKGHFSSYDKEDLTKACRVLNGGAGFILWIIFSGHADLYTEDLSPAYMLKTYGIAENTYRNGMDDLRKFGYIIDQHHNSYGIDFYCRTVVPDKWIDLIPKNRTGKKAEFGPELKNEYIKLMQSGLKYYEYTPEQQWLYQLGDMYDWPKEENWTF